MTLRDYYNENNPFAAAWLEELIKAGVIPPGDVDTRSIVDVRPSDLKGYRHVSLFAGIGGWSRALERAGRRDDPRTVWTISCPCQPFSGAGKQLGEKDERHLWPEALRLIGECQPPEILGEQVASKLGREWLARVRADLEELGYAVGAADLCSASAGAPHIRQRLHWGAYATRERWGEERSISGRIVEGDREEGRSAGFGPSSDVDGLAHAPTARRDGSEDVRTGRGDEGSSDTSNEWGQARDQQLERGGDADGLADADEGQRRGIADRQGRISDGTPTGRKQGDGIVESSCDAQPLAHADGGRQPQLAQRDGGTIGGTEPSPRGDDAGGCGDSDRLGDAGGQGLALGPLTADGRGAVWHQGSASAQADTEGAWSRYDIVHCTDGKARRFEPGSFPLAHGAAARVGRLRGYGNAINPELAAIFIQVCEAARRG